MEGMRTNCSVGVVEHANIVYRQLGSTIYFSLEKVKVNPISNSYFFLSSNLLETGLKSPDPQNMS